MRLANSNFVKEHHYTFFWQGKPEQETREHGIGFAARNHLLQMIPAPTEGTEKMLTLHLSSEQGTANILCIYTPQCQFLQKQKTNSIRTSIQQSRIYHQMSFSFYSETSVQEWGVTETYGQPAWVIMEWERWMRMDNGYWNSVAYTTFGWPTLSSRQSPIKKYHGDTQDLVTGAN